jgi:hypothetical protein
LSSSINRLAADVEATKNNPPSPQVHTPALVQHVVVPLMAAPSTQQPVEQNSDATVSMVDDLDFTNIGASLKDTPSETQEGPLGHDQPVIRGFSLDDDN